MQIPERELEEANVHTTSTTQGVREEAGQRLILVVANETCANPRLCRGVRERLPDGGRVLVVAPAHPSELEKWMTDDDEALAEARARLAVSLECLSKNGVQAEGRIGDADALLAIQDALFDFPADEIVICTHSGERPAWFRRDLTEQARRRFHRPVEHVEVASGGGRERAASTHVLA